jgi:hypothetical protein
MQSMQELTTWMDFSSAPKLTFTKLGMNIFCGSRIRTLADDGKYQNTHFHLQFKNYWKSDGFPCIFVDAFDEILHPKVENVLLG